MFEHYKVYNLSGQAIRTPTFRRFARIDSQRNTCFWSTWPDSRESRLLSDSHWNSRPILAAIPSFGRSIRKNKRSLFFLKRESIRANRPTKTTYNVQMRKRARQFCANRSWHPLCVPWWVVIGQRGAYVLELLTGHFPWNQHSLETREHRNMLFENRTHHQITKACQGREGLLNPFFSWIRRFSRGNGRRV